MKKKLCSMPKSPVFIPIQILTENKVGFQFNVMVVESADNSVPGFTVSRGGFFSNVNYLKKYHHPYKRPQPYSLLKHILLTSGFKTDSPAKWSFSHGGTHPLHYNRVSRKIIPGYPKRPFKVDRSYWYMVFHRLAASVVRWVFAINTDKYLRLPGLTAFGTGL
jgi:hypothetical protein